MVLLEIVTGIMPVTRGRVPPPEVPRQCPPDIWDLIQRCMVSEPEARPTAKVRCRGGLNAAGCPAELQGTCDMPCSSSHAVSRPNAWGAEQCCTVMMRLSCVVSLSKND